MLATSNFQVWYVVYKKKGVNWKVSAKDLMCLDRVCVYGSRLRSRDPGGSINKPLFSAHWIISLVSLPVYISIQHEFEC